MIIEALVKTVLAEMRTLAKTETVIGQPFTLEGVSIIPVTRLSIGFGAGGGKGVKDQGEGEATGGGATIEPVAFFVVRGDDVELISINQKDPQWAKAVRLVPQIIEKVKEMASKKEHPEPQEDEA